MFFQADCLGAWEHYMSPRFFGAHEKQLTALYNGICEKLNKYPNFNGIVFHCSDHIGEVVVDILHRKAYRDYAVRYFLTDSFEKSTEIIKVCEIDWRKKDNPEAIKNYYKQEVQKLIVSCEKWGYD